MFTKFLLIVISFIGLFFSHAEAMEVRIGVLAYRPKSDLATNYLPLVKSLKQVMPEHDFKVIPLNFSEIDAALSEHRLEFVVTNPVHYVQLSKRFNFTAPLATLINKSPLELTKLGGVIIARSDRADIQKLSDLQNKHIAGVSPKSLGGFHAQVYELSLAGLYLTKDYTVQFTGMPQDNVVSQVLDRKVDVGFVRTDVIEGMVASGSLSLSAIKIINPQYVEGFPLLLSTRLYPEWPLVALASVDKKLVQHLTATVLDIDARSGRNGNSPQQYFTSPSVYVSVEDLLRELRLPPYAEPPQFTYGDILIRYRWEALLFGLAGMLIALLSIRLFRLNRSLAGKHQLLESEVNLRHGLLSTMAEGVYGIDSKGLCTAINPAAQAMLGYTDVEVLGKSPHLVFHHHHENGIAYPEHDCPIYKSLADGMFRQGEEWFIRKNGEGFPVHLKVTTNPMSVPGQMGVVVVFHDITARKFEEQRIRQLAYHDPLTGLPNRILLDDRLAQALAIAKRSEEHVGMLFVDLDDFKPVNDKYGHRVGDVLLVEVGVRIRACLRDSDTAARIGGDEFVVLLQNIKTIEDAVSVAQKILSLLRTPYHLDGKMIQISASIGVAVDLQFEYDAMKLMNMADAAMYHTKAMGRNSVSVYKSGGQLENYPI